MESKRANLFWIYFNTFCFNNLVCKQGYEYEIRETPTPTPTRSSSYVWIELKGKAKYWIIANIICTIFHTYVLPKRKYDPDVVPLHTTLCSIPFELKMHSKWLSTRIIIIIFLISLHYRTFLPTFIQSLRQSFPPQIIPNTSPLGSSILCLNLNLVFVLKEKKFFIKDNL